MEGKKILMIVGDYVEDYEIMVPFQALQMVGHSVDVICPDKKSGETVRTSVHYMDGAQTFQESRGHDFTLNANFDDVKAEDYDALVLPGGRAPEYIRTNERVQALVRHFFKTPKPVAAICHGPQILIAADVIKGRKLTAYPTLSPDVKLAGAEFIKVADDATFVEGNLVTAPAWPAHPKWLAAFIKQLGTKITQTK